MWRYVISTNFDVVGMRRALLGAEPSWSTGAKPVPEAMEMFDSPTSGCGSEYSEPPDKLAYEAARDCLAVYSDADIALVNFTLSERDANGLADMVEEQVNQSPG